MTPPEVLGKRGECKPLPSTPEEAYLPQKASSHEHDHEHVPSTPDDAKMVDYEKLRSGRRIHEKNGRYYFYDTIGRKYECDDQGNKMWTSKRRPPQYDSYIWKKLGEDGRKAILEQFHNSPKKNGMIAADGRIIHEIDMSESSVQADNQNTYLSHKKHEFLHFNGDSGPIQIPWQYV